MTGDLVAIAPCWSCGSPFSFDPETVPSVGIDPASNLPSDLAGADPAAAVYRPICPPCVEAVAAHHRAHGRPDPWGGRR